MRVGVRWKFLQANALAAASAWASGDTAELVPQWNQYTNDQQTLIGSQDVRLSGPTGPFTSQQYGNVQDGQWRYNDANIDPSCKYIGTAASGWMQSQDPTQSQYAASMAPGY